jgi:O-antigen/teichoic acid export membrane protein
MTNKPMEAVFRPALILMSGRGLGFIAAFAIPMVLARVFDQDTFGTYKQLFLIYGTLFGIAQLGMAESLYYFLPVQAKKGGGYIFNTLMVLLGVGIVSALLLWILQAYVARLLNNPDLIGYIPWIGAYLLFMLLAVVLEIAMTVKKQHISASLTYAASDLLRTVLYIAPVLMFSSIMWLLLGAVCFALIRFIIAMIYVFREFGSDLRPDRPLLRKHLGYAIPFGLAGLIEVAQVNLHMYAVSYYFDVATFAIYAVGCLQVPLIDFLSTSTANVMMVNMREKLLENNLAAVRAIWLDTVRKLALIFCPLIFGLLLIANELIVLLFTSTYARSVPIFMIWTSGMMFSIMITSGVLRVFAETRFLIIQNLIHLVLIASLIQFFLVRFDLAGAVLVTLVATGLTKIITMIKIKSILQATLSELLPWKSLVSVTLLAALAAAPALLLKLILDTPDLITLISTGTVFTLSYFFLLIWFGPMREDEKRMLIMSVQSPLTWLLRNRSLKKTARQLPR